jgi:hypothetical protein
MAEEPGVPPGGGESEAGRPDRIRPDEEPGSGTLFIMLVFLMALAARWTIMYLTLLER